MSLSLRSRITFFFTALLSFVLLVAFVTVYFGHQRSRLAQIDEDLVRADVMVSKLINTDLDETALGTSSREALEELDLPGFSVAVFDAQGRRLAGDANVPVMTVAPLQKAVTEETTRGPARRYRARHERGASIYKIAVSHSLATLESELSSLRQALTASLAVALLLSITLGFWFSGAALRPVIFMARQARDMTGQTPGARLGFASGRDELGDLGRSFNGLLERIEATLAQQRQFMADASHELRTPVSVARTAVEVTQARAGRTESEYQECLRVVYEQVTRLSRIVEDLFALARADAGALPLATYRFYLDELAAACVRDANLLAAARGTTIERTGAEDLEISGDERLLGQMLSNLLDNAVRHGPPRGRVTIDLVKRDEGCEIRVGDSNEAIAEAEHERIFERFVRLDPARSGDGAGLGLSIARAIALAHGGTLRLEPCRTAGNTFVAVLPTSWALR